MNAARYAAIFLLGLAGCDDGPAIHPVSGQITKEDGSPINVGLVEFVPVAGGRSPRGRLTTGGEYRLTTSAEGDGAPAGEYVVVISQPQLAVGALRPAPAAHNDAHHDGQATKLGIVPPPYTRRRASPLRATVAPGENRCDFTLNTIDSESPKP